MTDLSRRAFFKRGFKEVTRTAVEYADKKADKKATQWIRPPFAIGELDFTLACTRCGDCINACPHDVIFPLPANYGASAVKTPALDLSNKACHLCEDWPCVTACEPEALKFPVPEVDASEQAENEQNAEQGEDDKKQLIVPIAPPKLAWVKITKDSCLPYQGPECGACSSSCKVEGALTWDMTKPVINLDLCCGCGLCRQACITDPSAITVHNLALLDSK